MIMASYLLPRRISLSTNFTQSSTSHLIGLSDKPEEEEAWAPLLYQIYLNLNKGDEFDEMDAIMKAMTTI